MKLVRFLAVSALALGFSSAAQAADTVKVRGGADFRAVVDRITGEIASNAGAAPTAGKTGTLYVDFNKPVQATAGFGNLSAGDQSLIRAVRRTYDLYRALGGAPNDGMGVVERDGARVYVGLDGEGGRWFASATQAVGFLYEQMAAKAPESAAAPPAGTAPSCKQNLFCLVKATYDGAVETKAYVPRGTTVTLDLTGNGFLAAGGFAPTVYGRDGLTVIESSLASASAMTAQVAIAADAKPGKHVLYVYNPGSAFRAVARYGVEIVGSAGELEALAKASDGAGAQNLPGTGEVASIADDHGDTIATASALTAQASGRIGSRTDVDVFRIDVTTPGVLRLDSAGPTDVIAVLSRADGTVVARDDDAGSRYNFRIENAVTPGVYFLRVSSCCGGSGLYTVTSALGAN